MHELVNVDDEQAGVPRVTRMMGDITITSKPPLCEYNDGTPESLPSFEFSARWPSPISQKSLTQTKPTGETSYNISRRKHRHGER